MHEHRRLVVITSAITAVLVMAISAVVWVVVQSLAEDTGAAGTFHRLEKAPEVGLWVPAGGTALVREAELQPGSERSVGGFDGVDGIDRGLHSWLVQITFSSDQRAALRVSGGVATASTTALLRVNGSTRSVSTLVNLGDDGTLSVLSDAPATLSVTAIAAFTGQAGEAPGPGGTAAVSAVSALTSGDAKGALPTPDNPAWISPAGLGDVPSAHVAGGWLQISADGSGRVLVGSRDLQVPVLELTRGSGSVLVPAGLDVDGRAWISTEGPVSSLVVDVVGWTAGVDPRADATVLDGGLVLAQPIADQGWPEAGALAPDGAISLFSIATQGTGSVAGEGELSGRPVGSVPTEGQSHVVTASAGTGAGDPPSSGTWWGFFAGPGGDSDLRVTIDSPDQGASIDLGRTGAQVTFEGRVSATAGLASLVLTREGRYLGSASVTPDGDGYRWSYTTPAATGEHTIEVEARDFAGETASAEVSLETTAPGNKKSPVIAPRTVVGGEDLSASVTASTATSLRLASPVDLRVGDLLVAQPGPELPDGRMGRVTAVRLDGQGMVVATVPAHLDEIFLQVDFDESLNGVSEETAGIEDSFRVFEPDQPVVPAPPTGGAGQAVRPESGRPGVIDFGEFEGTAEIARLRLLGEFTGEAKYETVDDKPTVKAEATASLDVDVNGETVVDEEFERLYEKVLDDGSPRTSATANLNVVLRATAVTYVNLTLRTHLEWNWAKSKVTVDEFKLSQTQTFDESLTFNATGEFNHGIDAELFRADPAVRAKSLKDEAREAVKLEHDPDGAGPKPAKSLEDRLTVRLGTVRFNVSVVPVWINVYSTVNASYGAHLEGEASGSQAFAYTYEVGVRYQDGNWAKVEDFNLTKEAQEASFSVDAMVSAVPFVTFKAMVYDVLGPTLDLSLMIELTAHAEGEAHRDGVAGTAGASVSAEAALDLYGFASIGVEIDLLDLDADWHSGEFELFRHRIWEWEGRACAGDSCPQVPDSEDTTATSAVGHGDRPLVLLLDTSSSMEGEKLDSAKESLRGVLNAQALGSEIGLFIYPYGDESDAAGCQVGDFVIDVEPVQGFGTLLSTIDEISTAGDTPTGPALRAVADELEAQGRTGATIMLVSDGESNCGQDPCEVATEIGARGFEVAIPTVSFNNTPEGNAQLQCIAEATSAKSYEVTSTDPEELWELVEELSLARMELGLSLPETLAEGESTTVEVTITNPSARDLQGVRLSVTPAAGSDGVAVTPGAQVVVGNVPPGATVTRQVLVTPNQSTSGGLRVLAWGRNVSADPVEATFAVVPAAELDVAPGPLLTPDDAGPGLVLGDGFAGHTAGACLEAAEGSVLAAAGAITDGFGTACPGASTRDLLDGVDAEAQLARVPDQGEGTVVATLSIGAEDVGLTSLLERCARITCPLGDQVVGQAVRVAQELDFASVYEEAAGRIASATDRELVLVVTAYPELFESRSGRQCSTEYSFDEARMFNNLITLLNRSAFEGAEQARKDGYPVYFADATAVALRGHTLCDDEPGVTVAGGLALNETGTVAVGQALARWSQGRDLAAPAREPASAPAHDAGPHGLSWLFAGTVEVHLDARPGTPATDVEVTSGPRRGLVIKAGQRLRVRGQGYAPGTSVTLMLYLERPVILGSFPVQEDGSVDARTDVPYGTPVGTTTLTLLGVTEEMHPQRLLTEIKVAAPVGFGPSLLLLLSGLIGIGGLVAWGCAWWRRRRPV